jgi:hypothetical protein
MPMALDSGDPVAAAQFRYANSQPSLPEPVS